MTPTRTPSETQDETPKGGKDKKLNVSVVVHTERGNVTYQAGDTPEPEHAELITNPDVWA